VPAHPLTAEAVFGAADWLLLATGGIGKAGEAASKPQQQEEQEGGAGNSPGASMLRHSLSHLVYRAKIRVLRVFRWEAGALGRGEKRRRVFCWSFVC